MKVSNRKRHSIKEKGEGAAGRHTVRQVVVAHTRWLLRHGTLVLALAAAGCTGPDVTPTNRRLELTTGAVPRQQPTSDAGDTGIVLAFSGGGARSAAFGYGVLSALAEEASPAARGRRRPWSSAGRPGWSPGWEREPGRGRSPTWPVPIGRSGGGCGPSWRCGESGGSNGGDSAATLKAT